MPGPEDSKTTKDTSATPAGAFDRESQGDRLTSSDGERTTDKVQQGGLEQAGSTEESRARMVTEFMESGTSKEGSRTQPGTVELPSVEIEGDDRPERRLPTPELTPERVIGERIANPEKGITLERLRETRPLVEQSEAFQKDKGQANVYNLLKQMKASGEIPAGWEVFPTEPGSPADKVGADYILANEKTGEFHFLDATQREDKGNVFELRREGIILYDPKTFDISGSLKLPDAGEQPLDIERKAEAFKADLTERIARMTSSTSPFKLGETPMPDARATTSDGNVFQVERLAEWAREQARSSGSDGERRNSFNEMADVVSRASRFETIHRAETTSPAFERQVRNVTEREITRFVLANLQREEYKSKRDTSGNSDVYFHEKTGEMKLTTQDGDRITSSNISNILTESRGKLLKSGVFLSQLNNTELKSLGIDPKDFKGLSGEDRVKAFQEAASKDPTIRKINEKIMSKLIDMRAEIEAGGKVGSAKSVPIVENIRTILQGRTNDTLLDREPPPKAQTPEAERPRPGREFSESMPRASEELSRMVDFEASGKKPIQTVSEWMELIVEQQEDPRSVEEKWSSAELRDFKVLAEEYRAGNPEAIDKVHDWLNHSESIRQETNRSSEALPPERIVKTGSPGETAPTEESGRPRRNVAELEVVRNSSRVIGADGTSSVQVEGDLAARAELERRMSRLPGDQRLSDIELKDLEEARRVLEERVQKGERLSERDSQSLEALRYLENNRFNPEVHRRVLEAAGTARPEGGFKAGEAASRLTGLSILMTAVIGVYLGTQAHDSDRPLRRARFGT